MCTCDCACFPTDSTCPPAAAVSRATVSLAASRVYRPVSAVCGEPAGDPRPKHPRHLRHHWSDVKKHQFSFPEYFRTEVNVSANARAQYHRSVSGWNFSQLMIMKATNE